MKIIALRIAHALFALYFILCLAYMYYAAIRGQFGIFLLAAVVSLAIEGFTVFILNNGDCPLIHIQRKIGDNKPFFELFMSPTQAKRAIPIFAKITWVGVGLLVIRLLQIKLGM